MKRIEREALLAWMAKGGERVLLEALPRPYYDSGHLPGARHFPHDRAAALANQVIGGSDTPVVVYCASETCANSQQAAQTLVSLGYRDVQVYVGGKQDWEAAGLPFER